MKKPQNTYSTDNLQLAAFLLAEGCHLIDLDKTNPRRVVFIFQDSPQRTNLERKFSAFETKIEPHKYFSAIKELKQRLYQ